MYAADENISCPRCQQLVIDWSQEQYIQPCPHTALIALDLGFEYISDEFEHYLPYSVDEIHDKEMNIKEIIQQIDIKKLEMFKMELGFENYYRYIGFIKEM